MGKVLLVTLQGANIGNRLQNYALQEVIKGFGHTVYTPYYRIPEYDSYIKRMKVTAKIALSLCGVHKYDRERQRMIRERRFKQFNDRYIDNRFSIAFDLIRPNFDYAVTGSDQVWHRWSDSNSELEYFYLTFMPEDKRVSYAASFGFSEFQEKDVETHRAGLIGIKYLSCREDSGQKLIKDLTGRDAVITLDPTLLLDKSAWQNIEKKPSFETGDFLLAYYLGNQTVEYKQAVAKIAEQKKLKIIDIYDPEKPDYYYTTPDEFVWLVEHASYICTDSFHACVFSILFNKKFLAFRRMEVGMDNMFGRIETLFRLYEIDREFKGDISAIYADYKPRDNMEKKKESLHFIEKALS